MRYDDQAHRTSHALWDLIKTGRKVKVVTTVDDVEEPEETPAASLTKTLMKALREQQEGADETGVWRHRARTSAKDAARVQHANEKLSKRVERLKVSCETLLCNSHLYCKR